MYLLGYTVIHTWEHLYHHKRLEALIVCHSLVNSCFLQAISKSLMLAFQETDHALLVEAVKCQQRSSEIAREGWRHYCGALADGVRDPQILEVFHGRVAFCGCGWGEKSQCMQISLVYKEWTTWLKCFRPWILFPRMGLQTNTESHCVVVLVVVVVDLWQDLPPKLPRKESLVTRQSSFGSLGVKVRLRHALVVFMYRLGLVLLHLKLLMTSDLL